MLLLPKWLWSHSSVSFSCFLRIISAPYRKCHLMQVCDITPFYSSKAISSHVLTKERFEKRPDRKDTSGTCGCCVHRDIQLRALIPDMFSNLQGHLGTESLTFSFCRVSPLLTLMLANHGRKAQVGDNTT